MLPFFFIFIEDKTFASQKSDSVLLLEATRQLAEMLEATSKYFLEPIEDIQKLCTATIHFKGAAEVLAPIAYLMKFQMSRRPFSFKVESSIFDRVVTNFEFFLFLLYSTK